MSKTNLKKQVEHCLQKHPSSRDCDQKLTLYVWIEFYPQFITRDENEKRQVRLVDILQLPREDNIKRIRARFNQEGLYKSEDIGVLRRRKQLENDWRERLGYERKSY